MRAVILTAALAALVGCAAQRSYSFASQPTAAETQWVATLSPEREDLSRSENSLTGPAKNVFLTGLPQAVTGPTCGCRDERRGSRADSITSRKISRAASMS